MRQQRTIEDFSESAVWMVETTLQERFGRPVEVHQADVELRLDPAIPVLTNCPALVWQVDNATFVVAKVRDRRYYCQFSWSLRQQYSTAQREYDDLLECLMALLMAHADQSAKRQAEAQDNDTSH